MTKRDFRAQSGAASVLRLAAMRDCKITIEAAIKEEGGAT